MLSAARDLLTDSLLLAGVMQRSDDERIKKMTTRRLLSVFQDPELFKDESHGTKLGEAELEKV